MNCCSKCGAPLVGVFVSHNGKFICERCYSDLGKSGEAAYLKMLLGKALDIICTMRGKNPIDIDDVATLAQIDEALKSREEWE